MSYSNMDQDSNNDLKKLWLMPLLAALAILLAGVMLEWLYTEHHRHDQQIATLQRLSTIRGRLEGYINSNILLVHGLAAEIALDPDMTQKKYAAIAEQLIAQRPQIRNIAGIRDFVISHVFPLRGNEAALGADLRDRPAQRAAAIQARDTGKIVFAGPVELIQGGRGFISRTPVFLPASDTGGGQKNSGGCYPLLSMSMICIAMPDCSIPNYQSKCQFEDLTA